MKACSLQRFRWTVCLWSRELFSNKLGKMTVLNTTDKRKADDTVNKLDGKLKQPRLDNFFKTNTSSSALKDTQVLDNKENNSVSKFNKEKWAENLTPAQRKLLQ